MFAHFNVRLLSSKRLASLTVRFLRVVAESEPGFPSGVVLFALPLHPISCLSIVGYCLLVNGSPEFLVLLTFKGVP